MIIFNCGKEHESEYEYKHFKLVKDNSIMLAVSMLDKPLEGEDINLKALPRNRYIRSCCYHAPDNHSMMIYNNNSSVYCYLCGFGGSIFDYLVKIHKVTYDQSLKILANAFDINIPNIELDKESLILAKQILENYRSDVYKELLEQSLMKTMNYKPEVIINPSPILITGKQKEQVFLSEKLKSNDKEAIKVYYKYSIYNK